MMIRLEPALGDQEQRLEAIAKDLSRLNSAVKAWRKACSDGALATRSKSAAQAVELADRLRIQLADCSQSWDFDARTYLADEWIQELLEAAAAADLRAFKDDDECVVPPLVLSSRPSQESIFLGKERLKMMRPKSVVKEIQTRLAKSRDAANQEFLESVFKAWDRRANPRTALVKFRDVYDMFCLAPGWKKDNSRAVFAQQIYGIHTSGLTTTRDGTPFNLQEPSSKVSGAEIFEVRARDGRPIRYYGISFATAK